MGCHASSWLGGGRAPLVAVHRQRHSKRGRSPDAAALTCCARGPARPAAPSLSPSDRRVWYDPQRRRRPSRPPKPVRRWIEADDLPALSNREGDRFLLVTFNILGDHNASNHRDLYFNIPSDFMRWDSRKGLICKEISRLNADIVCLQEVDRYNDILNILMEKGYAGSFKGRTGGCKDGCALFWKEKRFHLLEAESIEFANYGLRDNVAQLFAFESNEADSRRIVVCNIHVLFNPKRGDIKLGQVRMLLSKAHALSEKWGGIPVVLAGDFNSTPESAIYKFMSNSELNISLHDRRHLSGQEKSQRTLFGFPNLMPHSWTSEELENATGDPECTRPTHPFKLCSSYASIKGNARTRGPHGEPLVTTYHSKFLGTVDYLWYSSGLASRRVLDTHPIEALQKAGGLPNMYIGSDHLALVSEFAFTEEYSCSDYPKDSANSTEDRNKKGMKTTRLEKRGRRNRNQDQPS